ncbi:unnamed protein product [Prorocentrum cordatum]|uniref:Nitronate monooxygenase n=1 Tax=Prorocentrum cordatum TaxID=2364126 RepID=A0ABN9T0F1_9DINO|nr:unnamed protein product [Polarella glacialis]
MVLKTRLTEMLGIQHPIIQGGMQYVGYAEMASAVSNAGGLGVLTGLTQPSPEDLRAEIRRCREMTSKPFGVNLTILPALIPADYDGYVDVVAEERVALLEVAGASPKKYMKQLHAAGVKVLHKSATLRHALKAQEAGVDLIEIVGYEASIAGGQPGDEVGLWVVLPRAVPLLSVPVIASGASATGRQLAAALSMGVPAATCVCATLSPLAVVGGVCLLALIIVGAHLLGAVWGLPTRVASRLGSRCEPAIAVETPQLMFEEQARV